jgi:hypothetical protein
MSRANGRRAVRLVDISATDSFVAAGFVGVAAEELQRTFLIQFGSREFPLWEPSGAKGVQGSLHQTETKLRFRSVFLYASARPWTIHDTSLPRSARDLLLAEEQMEIVIQLRTSRLLCYPKTKWTCQ